MKFRLIVLIMLALSASVIVSAQEASYVGYKYTGVKYNHKLPNGVRDLGGNLLDNENYGISRVKKGKTEMLWLARITGRNSAGVPRWLVKDVLVLPTLKANQEILQGFESPCVINKNEDLGLVVLADYVPKNKTYKVNQAWRADSKTNKFQKIPTKGIVCN